MRLSAIAPPFRYKQLVKTMRMIPDMCIVHREGKGSTPEARISELVAVPEHILQVAIIFCQPFKKLFSGSLA